MSLRRVAAILPVLAIVLVACQPSASPGGSPGESAVAGECTVGVSWNNYQQPRWAAADEPAMQAAIEAGGGTYIRADARDSEEQQLTDIDSLINQGADVLIVLAKDNVAILPAIESAQAAGIPVIAYDRLIEDESTFYITFDNQRVGTLMAEVMLEAVPTGNYVIIKGHAADPNADFLREGMDLAGLADKVAAGDITIVYEEYTDTWLTEVAQANMETALRENDNNVDAVLSENDSMALGVVAALDDVGLAGVVPVSGQDGDPANLNNVARGLQLVDVWKDAFGLGQTAGSAAIQFCQGTALADITAPSDLGDHVAPAAGPNAQEFTTPNGTVVWSIVLTPTPITQENLNLPIDLGWIDKAAACEGAEPDVAACQ